MKKIDKIKQSVLPLLLCWLADSFACSVMKSSKPYNDVSNCGKTYPIDYIFYTNLFCEIKPNE